MNRIIILITLFTFSLNAYDFKLNDNDIEKINNSKMKSFIVKRLEIYEKLKTDIKDYELIKKLSHVNTFINKIFPKHDIQSGIAMDYWATPKEFLIDGYGDCEDYALAKYFTLIELGIPKEKLYLSVVKVKTQKDLHMVLLYVEDKNKAPLVLDNLSFRLIPFTKRPTLTPKFAFNEIDSYLLTKEKFTKNVRLDWGKKDKWAGILNRVYKLNE